MGINDLHDKVLAARGQELRGNLPNGQHVVVAYNANEQLWECWFYDGTHIMYKDHWYSEDSIDDLVVMGRKRGVDVISAVF